MTYVERVCLNVGLAVESFQWFENTFTMFQEFQKMVRNPDYRENTGGVIPESAFKTPTSKQVSNLVRDDLIDSEFADRIATLIDDRNKMIHRWVREEGWPDPNDESACVKLIDHAQRVVVESRIITSTLAKLLIEIVKEFDLTLDREKYLQDVGRLFLDANCQPLNWPSESDK